MQEPNQYNTEKISEKPLIVVGKGPYVYTKEEILQKQKKWMNFVYLIFAGLGVYAGLSSGLSLQHSLALGMLISIYFIGLVYFAPYLFVSFPIKFVEAASINIGMPVFFTLGRRGSYHMNPKLDVQYNLGKHIVLEILFMLLIALGILAIMAWLGIIVLLVWMIVDFADFSQQFSNLFNIFIK